jgi:hypothetical protein
VSAPGRAEGLAAYRAALDAVEQAGDGIPLPDLASHSGITWHLFTPDARRVAFGLEAALPCELTGAIDPKDAKYYQLTGSLHGVPVTITGRVGDLAERKVTGTTVVEQVEWVRKAAPAAEPQAAEGEQ